VEPGRKDRNVRCIGEKGVSGGYEVEGGGSLEGFIRAGGRAFGGGEGKIVPFNRNHGEGWWIGDNKMDNVRGGQEERKKFSSLFLGVTMKSFNEIMGKRED